MDPQLYVVHGKSILWQATLKVRNEIFVNEHGVPSYFDHEEEDKIRVHVLAHLGKDLIGTGRLTPTTNGWHISRIVVLHEYREHGIGSKILHKLEEIAKEKGALRLFIFPNVNLENYFLSRGYERDGSEVIHFEGNDLISMQKFLKKNSYI